MSEQVREGQRAQRSDRVDEEGVCAVERVDETTTDDRRPSPRLHSTADLQRQLIEANLPVRRVEAALARQPPQTSIRADIVEAMVVDADVREVRSHAFDGAGAGEVQELAIARGIELQHGRPELKPLCPFRPAARLQTAVDGVDRRTIGGLPTLLEGSDLPGRQLEEPIDLRKQIGG